MRHEAFLEWVFPVSQVIEETKDSGARSSLQLPLQAGGSPSSNNPYSRPYSSPCVALYLPVK